VLPDPRTTRFNICHVWINEHSATYGRVIAPLSGALVDLGYKCTITLNQVVEDSVNILVGSVIFAWPHRARLMHSALERKYVLYQFVQLYEGNPALREVPSYVEAFAEAAAIWEHSPRGIAYFQASPWVEKVHYLPPAYHRALESFTPSEEPQIDVLFCGNPTPRRCRILDELSERGVKAVLVFGAYGEPLESEIRNAKIILNLHSWSSDMLETVRLSHLLANRCFVVSEIGDHNPYGDGVVYAKYEDIADTCIAYLGPKARDRAAVAAEGYAAVRRMEMVDNLRQALARLPLESLMGTS
jgi:hypothetical protein